MHSAARGTLVKHHQFFTFLKAPERRRERPDVHRLGSDVEQMRQDATDFMIEYPNQLTTPGDFHTQKLLDCKTKGVLLRQRSDIVKPIEVRYGLKIGLGLD